MTVTSEKATFAAGCFWGVQKTFDKVSGVIETRVGYTGGSVMNPTYEKVCAGDTGHAEAVDILYDPAMVTYDELLDIFWNMHDPTRLNAQGSDYGEQYRSAIFYHSTEQEKRARESKAKLEQSGKHLGPIVTQIVPASDFYKAEAYHQKYYAKNI